MKPLVRRGLVLLGWTIGIGFVALCAALVWIAGTTPGLKFAIRTGTAFTPMKVKIERIEGRLWSSMRLGGIEVEQDGTKMRVESAELDWVPSSLFARRLHVHRFTLDGIFVTLGPPKKAPPPDPNKPLPEIELPVLVKVDTVRFRNIVLRQFDKPDSLGITEIALDGLQYRDSLGVQRFALATPLGELGFRGWVRTRGQYPLDIAIQWTLKPPDLPPIVGGGDVVGDLDTLRIRQQVTAPARLAADVRLEKLLTHPRFDATARLEPVDLSTIRKDLPKLTVGGTAGARGDLEKQEIEVAGTFASREYGRWNADAHALTTAKSVELSSLVLAQQGRPAKLNASGRADLDSTRTTFELLANWSEFAWPPVGDALVTLPRGDLDFGGELGAWRIDMETEVRTKKGLEESLRANGHGDSTMFVLEELTGSLLGGHVDAAGRVGWKPLVTWNLDATARDVDTGILLPEWPSKIGGRLRTHGSFKDSTTWAAHADLDDLAGELRGKPLAGQVHFHGRSDSTSLIDAEASYAGATFAASGTALAPIGVEWKLDVPSLAELEPTLAGTVQASGTLEGPDTLVHATVKLAGEKLAASGTTVGSLALDGRLDRTTGNAIDLVAHAREIASPPQAPFDSVRFTVNGTPERYAFTGTVESALRRLALRGEASQAAESLWTGRLDQFDLAVANNAPWSLAAPAPFEVTPSRARFGPFGLRAATAKLDANAEWSAGTGTRVDAALAGLPLANVNAFLPTDYRLEGTLSLTSQAHLRNDGVLDAEAKLEPASGKVTWQAPKAEPVEIPFTDLRMNLRSDATALRVDGGLKLPDVGEASTAVNLPGFRWNRFDSTQVVDGTIEAHASKWDLVEKISPDVQKLEGKLDADVKIAGTIASPSASGVVKFENGAFDLPAYGFEAHDVHLTAQGEGGRWNLDSGMKSDSGHVAVKADADLSNANRPRGTMQIEGKRFKVMNTNEARILVTPDLDIKVDGRRVDVTGELTVPVAHVDAGNRSIELAVPPSPDVVVLREAPDSTKLPFDLYSRVRLTLGDDVQFKGYGIKAAPEGSLLITQEPNKPALGRGELSLKSGTYTGYGRDLTIERGRLIYAGGPVDDPQVEIRAKREIEDEDVLVGFEVTGTLKQSQMSVFSDPEMTQADALSYLMFNRPIAEARSSESAIARETATSMGLQAASAQTQKVASKIGLNEASVESEGTLQEAALMLGTYLTPSLYARYGIGLFDSANSFQLAYSLSKHWKVEAETSEQNRAGIIYSIEP
ncbi:MAG: translocation/assembly module TamB domain-containing protein [Candidatus Eiseniibacteriota bacterium]